MYEESFQINQKENKIPKEKYTKDTKAIKKRRKTKLPKHIWKELNCIHDLMLLSHGTNPAY